MPKPRVFTDLEEFRSALASSENITLVRNFFAERRDSIEDIVKASVAGNTFRAFPFRRLGLPLKPSAVYREWATRWLRGAIGELRSIRSRHEMRSFVTIAATQLDKHWSGRTGGKHTLGFGRAAKLLNLTIKHAMWLNAVTERERERLIPLLDVPLDSYTLQGIRSLLPALQPIVSCLAKKGSPLFSRLVLDMGYVFRPTGTLDAGIDGEIEIRNVRTGEVASRIIKVQSKAVSHFSSETDTGFGFRPSADDVKYWLGGNVPVIVPASNSHRYGQRRTA